MVAKINTKATAARLYVVISDNLLILVVRPQRLAHCTTLREGLHAESLHRSQTIRPHRLKAMWNFGIGPKCAFLHSSRPDYEKPKIASKIDHDQQVRSTKNARQLTN